MPNCKINGCKSNSKDISLFRVPTMDPNRSRWIEAIEKTQEFDYITQTYYVCQSHFLPEDIQKRGKKTFVISGRVPSVFSNTRSNENVNSQGIEINDNSCKTTTPVDSCQSNVNSDLSDVENNSTDLYDVFPDIIDNFEYVSEKSSITDHETGNQAISGGCNENTIVISKTEYKNLINEMVESAKLKLKVIRMQNYLKEKSDKIDRLQKKVRCYELMEAKETAETENKNQNPDTQNEHITKESRIFEILECLLHGKRFYKYSPNIRIFCLTIAFYSPKAYEYIRTFFNLNLPSIRTIRNWYSTIDATAGFTEASFNSLQQKADELKAKGKRLIVGLIHDDVAIRKHSQWSSAEKKFLGHINAGKTENYDDRVPLAKEAYVLMVTGVTEEFKTPIGYFLIDGLCAEERAAIITEALFKLNKIGVIVSSITNDGHIVNIATLKKLGVDFDADKPYFTNPFNNNYTVYIILDPPHMIKLARNCIGNKQVIYDGDGNEIRWTFFQNLVNLQIDQNINFGNKLTKTHLEFEDRKMDVRLAAQTLSESTASSMEYLDKVLNAENFQGSEDTVKYFRIFNNLFDIMNSKPKHCDDKYKRPISDATINQFRSYFESARKYIEGLQMGEGDKRKPILKTRSFTPYFGFYHNMISFFGIYENYIKANELDEFYTFNVSQDHLECYFGCIRRMGGCNDNPTAQQFMGAYRKLLLHNEVMSGNGANCINDITKVLYVSSKKSNPTPANKLELEQLSTFDLENQIDYSIHFMENDMCVLKQHSMALLASNLEERVLRKLSQKGRNRCLLCMQVFVENEISDDSLIQFKTENDDIVPPCKSTIELIQHVENLLKIYETLTVSFNSVLTHIVENINVEHFYQESTFDEDHDHMKREFIEIIIKCYMDIKSTEQSKIITRLSQKKIKRHTNLKEVHRLGQ